jgi:hypothetical protein
MSKNIKRDDDGCPILPGSITFGNVVRPKGGRRQPRSNMLREIAQAKFIRAILKRPEEPHVPCKQEVEYLKFSREFAKQPKLVQFAYHRARLSELEDELAAIKADGSKRKIELLVPILKQEIVETVEEMRSLYERLKCKHV